MSDIPQEITDKIEKIAESAYTPQDREYIINYVSKGYHLRDGQVEELKKELELSYKQCEYENDLRLELQQKDQRIEELQEMVDLLKRDIQYYHDNKHPF